MKITTQEIKNYDGGTGKYTRYTKTRLIQLLQNMIGELSLMKPDCNYEIRNVEHFDTQDEGIYIVNETDEDNDEDK